MRLLVRPEQIVVGDVSAAGTAAGGRARIEAKVIAVSYFGHDAAVHLQVLTSGRLVTARVLGLSVPMPESVVSLSVTGPVAAYRSED